ncbi:replicative DNA helicase [Leucobacter sp. HY1908]
MVDETPRDELAERSVLGASMLSRRAAGDAVEALTVDDFYVPKYGTVFAAIAALVSRAEPVDAITVGDELSRAGELTRMGGPGLLHEMTEAVPTASNVGHYVEIVRERAVLRRLMEAGGQIVHSAVSGVGAVDEAVEAARSLVDGVSRRVVRDASWIGEGLSGTFEQLRSGAADAAPTLWSKLNAYIGGLRPGCLYVVGARPGVGKTVVGLNLAAGLAESRSVGFVSLEMSEEELRRRLLSAEATVHLGGLLDANLSVSDWEALSAAEGRVRALRLSVYDQASSLSQVLSYARTLHRRGGLGLLVVDYLQLMKGDGRAESRQVEVSEFSRALKLLAKELQIPVVALSQLNRESAGRKGGEPKISDLRESGSLEQDADVVLLLHRDEERKPGLLKIAVAKNRHGRPGDFTLNWEGKFARAVEMPWDPTAVLNERGF